MSQFKLVENWFFGLVLIVCAILYFHNLGSNYISVYDELIHVNVVKNLEHTCCIPLLHAHDLGTDYTDWSNNHVWLHKPLLPFYTRVVMEKLFGGSLFVFRLPSALCALITISILYSIGRRFFNWQAGLISAALYGLNPYVFELVQGRQFSDLSDLMFVMFAVSTMGLVLYMLDNKPKKIFFILFGLLLGFAYECKGGLALAPGVLLFGIFCIQKNYEALKKILLTLLLFVAVVGPEKLFFSMRFAKEYRYEQSQQINHLFMVIESWGRPWDYYVTTYWQLLMGPLLAGFSWCIMMFGLSKIRQAKIAVLLVWILLYIIPLSFGVSKISNFIMPVLPAVALLTGAVVAEWIHKKYFLILGSICFAVVSFYFISYIGFFHSQMKFSMTNTTDERFAYSGFFLALSALWFGIVSLTEKRKGTEIIIKIAMWGVVGLVIVTSVRSNVRQSEDIPPYAHQQDMIRISAPQLSALPSDTIIFVHAPDMVKGYLYMQYWTGKDSLEMPGTTVPKSNTNNFHAIILSDKILSNYKLVKKIPFGYWYAVN